MQISRRRLGRVLLAMSAGGTASWCGISDDLAASGAIDAVDFPVLISLASLYRDRVACQRIALAISPAVVALLSGSKGAAIEERAARMWKSGGSSGRAWLDAQLADDFRHARTVQAGAFQLAETEAELVLIRSSVR